MHQEADLTSCDMIPKKASNGQTKNSASLQKPRANQTAVSHLLARARSGCLPICVYVLFFFFLQVLKFCVFAVPISTSHHDCHHPGVGVELVVALQPQKHHYRIRGAAPLAAMVVGDTTTPTATSQVRGTEYFRRV